MQLFYLQCLEIKGMFVYFFENKENEKNRENRFGLQFVLFYEKH